MSASGAQAVDVVVVGAGLAGLACAHELQSTGASVVVLEREPRAGGRVRLGEVDGCPIDLGAHFLSPRYATVRRLIGAAGLESRVRSLAPSYATAILRDGRWHHIDYGRPLSVARFSAVSLPQRARLALMALPVARTARTLRFFDVASAAAVDARDPARLVGDDALRYVLAPVSQAFCGYGRDDVTLPLLSIGARFPLRAPLTLEGGLGQLGPALASRLPVRCATAVDELSVGGRDGVVVRAHGSGGELRFVARAAVVATTPSAALRVWPGAPTPVRDFLASCAYTHHFHAYLRTDSSFAPTSPRGDPLYMEIVPGGESSGVLSHVSFAAGSSVADGGLVFVAARSRAVAAEADDERLAGQLQDELERIHPQLRGRVVARRSIRWTEKVPRFPPGHTRAVAAFRRSLTPGPVDLAGDYLYGPLMEGAAQSGVAAARRVAAYLAASPRPVSVSTPREVVA